MRKASIIISICTMIAVTLTMYGQGNNAAPAPGTELSPIMKQISTMNGALTTTMKDRNMSAAEIAKDADKLQDLFKQVSTYMKDHKIDDATTLAADTANAAGDLSKAAKSNEFEPMKAAYTKLSKACGTCHAAHREQLPDKSYKLKSK